MSDYTEWYENHPQKERAIALVTSDLLEEGLITLKGHRPNGDAEYNVQPELLGFMRLFVIWYLKGWDDGNE